MHYSLLTIFSVSVALAAPTTLNGRAAPPIKVSSASFLGGINSTTTRVVRDLGFQGRLGNNILHVYGDSLYKDAAWSDTFRGMSSGSVALATSDPLKVRDTKLNSDGWPEQFIPIEAKWKETPADDAMGGTNVIETSSGQGVVYFLKNHRPGGVSTIIGAGVATVTMNGDVPSAQRVAEYWWDGVQEPWYGDVCAFKDANYVYAFGHGMGGAQVFVARAKLTDATKLEGYEYWNGKTWQTDRLKNPTEAQALQGWWETGQGQVIWSRHYKKYMFVYADNFEDRQINAKTADSITGPWSDAITLYKVPGDNAQGIPYAMIPHPHYDESGKTLVVSYTLSPNRQQAIKVTFE